MTLRVVVVKIGKKVKKIKISILRFVLSSPFNVEI